jgi:prepilin-type N-terminal cleavage/methylation domain-containing protein
MATGCKLEIRGYRLMSLLCKQHGFTLVELSIVIVIIGLIVAGVTAGQSLVAAAKIQSQITELKKYEVAYNIFKLEYNAVPGDMSNAISYWP